MRSLPEECVVEIFRWLDVHELLTAARVCCRWRSVAQDSALWRRTRFSSIDTDRLLTEHFTPLSSPRVDHTGAWTRCERVLGRLRLMCRSVDLDYVEAGEGVSYRLLRSISCLQQLHHPTIVPLLLVNVDVPRNTLQLFYGDVGVPLETVLKERQRLAVPEVRCVLRQVMQALAHCHAQGITHRNLKPKYILLEEARPGAAGPPGGGGHLGGALPGERWNVRLSDFNSVRWLLGPTSPEGGEASSERLYGAARVLGASSPTVVTLPYRAPEILLGCAHYTTAIDVWAIGCVFAEMVGGSMIFVGDSDIGQLFKIFKLLGTPGAHARWPGVEELPYYNQAFPSMRPAGAWEEHPAVAALAGEPHAASLFRRMLELDPAARIAAAAALDHPFLLAAPEADGASVTPPRPPGRAATPSGGPSRASGGLFGTPCVLSGGDGGWVWEAWRKREVEQAAALRLEAGTAAWRRTGEAADSAREEAALWLQGAACEFCRSDRSVHLAVNILDHLLAAAPAMVRHQPAGAGKSVHAEGARASVLSAASSAGRSASPPAVDPRRVRVCASAALLLACKFQEVETHTVEQLALYCKHEHSVAELLEAELRVCVVLAFDFAFPTAVDCLFCVLGRLSWPRHFAVHRGASKQVAMLAQFFCDLSLAPPAAAPLRPSLLAAAALCLAAAALHCGRWADGSPGAAASALAYWTPAMAQATGYAADQLRPPLDILQAEHEAVHAELGRLSPSQLLAYASRTDAEERSRWAPVARKFRCKRFLNVLGVPPFAPHSGGALPPTVLVHDDCVVDHSKGEPLPIVFD